MAGGATGADGTGGVGLGGAGEVAGAEGVTGLASVGAGTGEAQPTNQINNTASRALGASRANRLTVKDETGEDNMWLILLEALGAGLLLALIVWWTMFSGRPKDDDTQDGRDQD